MLPLEKTTCTIAYVAGVAVSDWFANIIDVSLTFLVVLLPSSSARLGNSIYLLGCVSWNFPLF